MKLFRPYALGIILLFAGAAQAIEEGKPAPAFTAKLLNGEHFVASGSNQVVLINFWATWCEPCRKEMPAMEAYFRKHRDEGFRIVAVSMDYEDEDAKVREVMKAYSFDAALGRDADYKGYGRIWRLPLSFVIDRNGILRRDGWFGQAGLDEASLEKDITPLLGAK
jgi:cytochrome c biogenesis protein CcmG/thiol:disulfide interchange protein DsbE